MSAIQPTPGRVVWYYPAPHDGIAQLNGQPLAAIVAGVHNDNLVNLAVFDAYGNSQQRSNVHLVQPGNERPNSAHATWMPYQVGQAAKNEQLQAQITPLPVINADAMLAESDGTSASETGLVNTESVDTENDGPDGEATGDEADAK